MIQVNYLSLPALVNLLYPLQLINLQLCLLPPLLLENQQDQPNLLLVSRIIIVAFYPIFLSLQPLPNIPYNTMSHMTNFLLPLRVFLLMSLLTMRHEPQFYHQAVLIIGK